jgi:phage baseplate assembly protein W
VSNTGGAQTNFGSAWNCVTDVAMPSVMVSGNTVVAQSILRRLTTPRGRLIDDANYGYDLTQFLNAALTTAQLSQIAKQAAAECAKDAQVLRASLTVMLTNGVLLVTGTVYTANGPFQLVLSVSAVTVALLQVSPG